MICLKCGKEFNSTTWPICKDCLKKIPTTQIKSSSHETHLFYGGKIVAKVTLLGIEKLVEDDPPQLGGDLDWKRVDIYKK